MKIRRLNKFSSSDRTVAQPVWMEGDDVKIAAVSNAGLPRLTFGIIVLNGEPFLRYNLRSLYPFAHQIIVVEGASLNAAATASADGHSIDGTLTVLRRFKIEEDPEDKLTIVTAEDHGYANGFWPGEKDEQSDAYARRAQGDYLWQVDVDEFYRAEDIHFLAHLLAARPDLSGVSFYWKNFWGGFDYLVDGWDYRDLVQNMGGIRRVFRWGNGYRYSTHRPPTVVDDQRRNLFTLNWFSADDTAQLGLYCYHYGMVLPAQAKQKTIYYKNLLAECEDMPQWYEETFLNLRRPFHVLHGTKPPSWLLRFTGNHPTAINSLIEDASHNLIAFEERRNADIESLLTSWRYRAATFWLRNLYFIVPPASRLARQVWISIGDLLIHRSARKFLRRSRETMNRWMTTH